MDLRRLRIGEWIAAISGILLIVSLFLPWGERDGRDLSGWDALSVTDVLLALLALAALALWVVTSIAKNPAPGVAADALVTPFALVMTVVCLFKIGDGTGAWLGLAATLGVLAGALIAMRDERLSKDGRPTDQTGVPVAEPVRVETLPGPPAA